MLKRFLSRLPVIPVAALLAVAIPVCGIAARWVQVELFETSAGGYRLDLPATMTCPACGKLTVRHEGTSYKCPFCSHVHFKR